MHARVLALRLWTANWAEMLTQMPLFVIPLARLLDVSLVCLCLCGVRASVTLR